MAVVSSEKINDELIAKSFVSALDIDANADDIEAEVDDGVVTLSAGVPRWIARGAKREPGPSRRGRDVVFRPGRVKSLRFHSLRKQEINHN